jgi:hypothetical protein
MERGLTVQYLVVLVIQHTMTMTFRFHHQQQRIATNLLILTCLLTCVTAFQIPQTSTRHKFSRSAILQKPPQQITFPPSPKNDQNPTVFNTPRRTSLVSSIVSAATTALLTVPLSALAASSDTMLLTPQTFQPVCPASDGFYRILQGTTEAAVGRDAMIEYGPLIAGGLLRIRLELCVVESFFSEAVGPFIQQNGLSWVLPVHETVETFLAGTIFALATTFILVGSTKIVTVIVTYADVFLGGPLRTLGGFALDRAQGKPIVVDIGLGPWKTRILGPPDEEIMGTSPDNVPGFVVQVVSGAAKSVGEGSKLLRQLVEAVDLFVGRYLVLYATAYIAIKLIHYKVFPDFP